MNTNNFNTNNILIAALRVYDYDGGFEYLEFVFLKSKQRIFLTMCTFVLKFCSCFGYLYFNYSSCAYSISL